MISSTVGGETIIKLQNFLYKLSQVFVVGESNDTFSISISLDFVKLGLFFRTFPKKLTLTVNCRLTGEKLSNDSKVMKIGSFS